MLSENTQPPSSMSFKDLWNKGKKDKDMNIEQACIYLEQMIVAESINDAALLDLINNGNTKHQLDQVNTYEYIAIMANPLHLVEELLGQILDNIIDISKIRRFFELHHTIRNISCKDNDFIRYHPSITDRAVFEQTTSEKISLPLILNLSLGYIDTSFMENLSQIYHIPVDCVTKSEDEFMVYCSDSKNIHNMVHPIIIIKIHHLNAPSKNLFFYVKGCYFSMHNKTELVFSSFFNLPEKNRLNILLINKEFDIKNNYIGIGGEIIYHPNTTMKDTSREYLASVKENYEHLTIEYLNTWKGVHCKNSDQIDFNTHFPTRDESGRVILNYKYMNMDNCYIITFFYLQYFKNCGSMRNKYPHLQISPMLIASYMNLSLLPTVKSVCLEYQVLLKVYNEHKKTNDNLINLFVWMDETGTISDTPTKLKCFRLPIKKAIIASMDIFQNLYIKGCCYLYTFFMSTDFMEANIEEDAFWKKIYEPDLLDSINKMLKDIMDIDRHL